MSEKAQFTITIVDAGRSHDVPAIARLKRLLKGLLRTYSFRVVDIKRTEPTETTGGGGTEAGGLVEGTSVNRCRVWP